MKTRTASGQRTLGRDRFTSASVFAAERERLFRASWLLVATFRPRAGRALLPVRTRRRQRDVLRDADGAVRAFPTTVAIAAADLRGAEGTLGSSIRCPTTPGTAASIPPAMRRRWPRWPVSMPPTGRCTRSRCRSRGLHLRSPRPRAAAVAARGYPGACFARHETAALRAVHRRFTIAAVWKLVFHNFSESTTAGVHPQLNADSVPQRRERLEEGPVCCGPVG